MRSSSILIDGIVPEDAPVDHAVLDIDQRFELLDVGSCVAVAEGFWRPADTGFSFMARINAARLDAADGDGDLLWAADGMLEHASRGRDDLVLDGQAAGREYEAAGHLRNLGLADQFVAGLGARDQVDAELHGGTDRRGNPPPCWHWSRA